MDRLPDLIIRIARILNAHSDRDCAPAVPVKNGCDDQGLDLATSSISCTRMLTTSVAER